MSNRAEIIGLGKMAPSEVLGAIEKHFQTEQPGAGTRSLLELGA
ncbi:hypothetical protein Nwat_0462 [Nitrosococcus watsonii C-113]|uniref:Uncharacterized protein n=1 Tax=Nitrosococcus watsoni (strain C-113) TaxID=105559 RepID=D8KAB2_NITWC|nr:hypothetical protein Nwat_0462 [Nitrosococcus watsonii C-113]